jgi:RES domain-containing protein
LTALIDAVSAVPRRRLSGRFWHQGSPGRPVGSFADPAASEGRYHRLGGTGVWYASDREQAAWAELFRHFLDEGVDPFEVLRRVGAVDVDGLQVLDLTNPVVISQLGVDPADLVGDDYSPTQALADAARTADFEGLLAPSAALPDRRTLVVFDVGMPQLTFRPSRVRRPPPRLADFLMLIRPHPDVPDAVRRTLHALALAGAEVIRRLRDN